MDEMFEPKKKERLDKDFFKGFIFIFVLGLFLVVGTSYSLEFFKVNKNGASIQFSTSAISINVTGDNTVNTTLSKYIDSEGLLNGLEKELTITNNNSSHGEAILKVERTSGVELSNLHYALIINNIVQKVDTVSSDGVIFDNVIMGNETLNVKVVLWVDNDYSGSNLTFNGTISNEIKRTYNLTSDILDDVIDFNNITTATNNYVSFNNEVYRIVKIEDNRIVICKNADFDSTAASRVNSNKFNSSLTYTDNSIIYSHSTDNKNLYLVKTVNIKSGRGTQSDPFILENNRGYLNDKKISNYITYKDDNNTTLFTQPVYYGQDNYVYYQVNDPNFQGYSTTNGGSVTNNYGGLITNTTDTTFYAVASIPKVLTATSDRLGNITLTVANQDNSAMTDVSSIEYSKDNTNWQSSNVLQVSDSGTYPVYARITKTNNSQEVLTVNNVVNIRYIVTYRWGHVLLNTQEVAKGTTITLPTTDYSSTIMSHITSDFNSSIFGIDSISLTEHYNIVCPNNNCNYKYWCNDVNLTNVVTTSTINSDTTFYYAGVLVDNSPMDDYDRESIHNLMILKDSDLTQYGLTYVSDSGWLSEITDINSWSFYTSIDTSNRLIHGTINGVSGYYFDIAHYGGLNQFFDYSKYGHMDIQFRDLNNNLITYRYYLFSMWNPCLLSGTEVTVEVEEEDEDKKKRKKWKKKKIEDITYDDDLVVWDFDKGEFTTAKPLWIMETKETDEYYHITFEDGSYLNAVTAHRIFNLDLNKFTYMNDDKLTPIGTRVYKEDGTITRIVSKEKVYKVSKYHNIVTEYHLNLFANGILTSCRLNNMYEIKDMKYVKDNRILRDRSEFYDIDDKYIDGFRLLEQPREDINRMNAVYHGADLREYVITNFLNHKK